MHSQLGARLDHARAGLSHPRLQRGGSAGLQRRVWFNKVYVVRHARLADAGCAGAIHQAVCLQVNLATQTMHLAARTEHCGGLGVPCFSPCSQYLLLPWEGCFHEPFCLDVPCSAGIPGPRRRLATRVCRYVESFACLADGPVVAEKDGLLVDDWQAQLVQEVTWERSIRDARTGWPLLASCPQRQLLAALLPNPSGDVLVFET